MKTVIVYVSTQLHIKIVLSVDVPLCVCVCVCEHCERPKLPNCFSTLAFTWVSESIQCVCGDHYLNV